MFFELEFQRHGGILTLDLEFPQGIDKSTFLENNYFLDLVHLIKHKLTTLLMTAEAGYKTSIH